ncbi:MAG: DNA-binding response regulator [Candidatus Puniceispirillum sp.]|nr:DNA-binding response regulator [Candidatus Pelagibacter sp.]MBA4282923.1 DNA-binding response regulator [Candidatus Puniceispirillum sp.]
MNKSSPLHVLVVDDDKAIRNLLVSFLSQHNFSVIGAQSCSEARHFMSIHTFDVIILDIMMPKETGYDFLKSLRAQHNHTPIILLSALDQTHHKIDGFECGAMDYITKPFEPLELCARVRNVARFNYRVEKIKQKKIVQFGNFILDLEKHILAYNEREVSLSSTELVFLKTLALRINEPVSREELSQKIAHKVSERAVDVQINRLRHKIKNIDDSNEYIQTFRHLGYALKGTYS